MQEQSQSGAAPLFVAVFIASTSSLSAQSVEPCEIIRLETGFPSAGDQLGRSVSIAGDVVIAGAPRRDPPAGLSAGAAFVFERTGVSWNQTAILTASVGAFADEFGNAVANTTDTILVGAHLRDTGFMGNTGAAYVFERQGANWIETAVLTSATGAAGDEFGFQVVLEGDLALVSAPFAETSAGVAAGVVNVFQRLGGAWSQVQVLDAMDAGAGNVNGVFGYALSLSGGYLVVGSLGDDELGIGAGAAYVYKLGSSGFVWQAKLAAFDTSPGDRFGHRVANFGDTIHVGSYLDDVGSTDSGSSFIFEQDPLQPGAWVETAHLHHAVPEAGDAFGFAVAMAEDVALVGCPHDDNGSGSDAGSMFVFRRDTNGTPDDKTDDTWARAHAGELVDSTPNPDDQFGADLAIDGDTVVVGEYLGDNPAVGGGTGSATIWSASGQDFPSLSGVPEQLSIVTGGMQRLKLNACTDLAGSTYVMLGTTSGTLPGFELLGHHVPLNPSGAWWGLTSSLGAGSHIFFQVGVLGGGARASVAVFLPPGLLSAAFTGVTVHHAYGVLAGGQLSFVSNAAPLQLVQ